MNERLDSALAARGLARSRTHAARLIEAGLVTVDGAPQVKPSTRVGVQSALAVAASDHYVSRAAHKLVAALDSFAVDPRGSLALDLGASTGGFTQVLRERGADPVIALDVGHGQLSEQVRTDPGVIVVEGFNARSLTPDTLAEAAGIATPPALITADVSFISLSHLLPPAAAVLADDGSMIALVKPQFEVGRAGVREGLVTDPAARADAVAGVLWSAWDAGLGTHGVISSPIAGTHGNQEYLVWLRPSADGSGNPTEWMRTVNESAGER